MRAVDQLFISRSRAAFFWFTVAWTVPVLAAWYTQSVVANLRTLPQFVMGGLPTFHYQAPDFGTETIQQLHAAQTRLAMETIFNRSPSGLDHQDRRFHLFNDEANKIVNQEVVAPQVLMFRDTNAYQKVEIERIDVNIQVGQGEATTLAFGQLIRTSVEDNLMVNKAFSVKVFFNWKSNPNPEERALYPTICDEVTFFSTLQTFP